MVPITSEKVACADQAVLHRHDGDTLCDPGNVVNLDSQEVASLISWRG